MIPYEKALRIAAVYAASQAFSDYMGGGNDNQTIDASVAYLLAAMYGKQQAWVQIEGDRLVEDQFGRISDEFYSKVRAAEGQ